jgi:hypothetical protein
MLPIVVVVDPEIDLEKRTPLRPLRLADEVQSRFVRSAIGFPGITFDAGANNIFPGCRAAPVTWNDMVEIQIFAFENTAAVLAGIPVTLENIVPGEFYFLLGKAIKQQEHNHPRDTDFK